MNRSLWLIIGILSLFMVSTFFSCDDELKYSTNSSHRLSFSTDTIHFDTVFTKIGSATEVFKVYNKNKEHLNITSIELAGSEKSPFRINVDGHSGVLFKDLDIRKNDSMYVFVEVNIDPNDEDNPILVKDSLIFYTNNGNRQDIKLLAYGQDVIIFRSEIIQEDTEFNFTRPILIYDSLQVNEGATLRIAEGTKLHFHGKSYLHVYGTLKAEGTLENPVIFRGDRLDWMFSYAAYDFLPGQWGGIRFHESSFDNELNYVDIHGGEYGILCDSTNVMDQMKLTLENSMIHSVSGNGLYSTANKIKVGNTLISNALTNCVKLDGGEAEFVHCSILGFGIYGRGLSRKGVALSLNNGENNPLVKADFINCMITGTQLSEISGISIPKESTSELYQYRFKNSFLKTVIAKDQFEPEDSLKRFQNVFYEEKKEQLGGTLQYESGKNFLYIAGEYEYFNDYRLDETSDAINIGDIEAAREYPYDLWGRPRLWDEAPDAGCFEWQFGESRETEYPED